MCAARWSGHQQQADVIITYSADADAAAAAAVAAVGLTCLVVFLPQACLSGNGILHTVWLSPPSYLLCLCKRSTYSDDNTHNFYSPAVVANLE